MFLCFFFFFKQKTAYEMRISDWSSDVCSSDLALAHVCTVVWDRAAKKGARGRTVTLKLRYADFRTITRAKSVPRHILDGNSLLAAGEAILGPLLPTEPGSRLLGVTLGNFEGEEDAGDGEDRPEETRLGERG